MVFLRLKIRFGNLEWTLVGQRISFLDSNGDALEKITSFSTFYIDECDSFSYVLDQFGGFSNLWSSRLDRNWCEDVGIGDICEIIYLFYYYYYLLLLI